MHECSCPINKVDPVSYLIVKSIGKGAYGEVALAFSKTNGKCAIKSVLSQHINMINHGRSKHDALNQITHEATVLRDLQHPCIVQVIF
jgi:serine/threonine protein kinase